MRHRSVWAFAVCASMVLASCGRSGDEQAQSPTSDAAQAAAPKTRAVEPAAEAPHWSYESATGPANWATLSAEWSACGGGRSQSPIDIRNPVKADVPAMRADFKPAQLKIAHLTHVADAVNNGHTIQVNCTQGDLLTIGAEQFELLQYHFHSPSEHTVAGKHYPMEMHLVHKAVDGKLAVVGVFIEEGAHNAVFDPIWSNLPTTKGIEIHFENVTVDVGRLLPAATTSYRYDGSLTTPPCSESVKWIVMTTPIQLSAEQIGAFRNIIQGNNRPVQPLNGRPVVTDRVSEGG